MQSFDHTKYTDSAFCETVSQRVQLRELHYISIGYRRVLYYASVLSFYYIEITEHEHSKQQSPKGIQEANSSIEK